MASRDKIQYQLMVGQGGTRPGLPQRTRYRQGTDGIGLTRLGLLVRIAPVHVAISARSPLVRSLYLSWLLFNLRQNFSCKEVAICRSLFLGWLRPAQRMAETALRNRKTEKNCSDSRLASDCPDPVTPLSPNRHTSFSRAAPHRLQCR